MDQATLIGGLIMAMTAIVGLGLSVGRPVVNLNSTITRLEIMLSVLEKKYENLISENKNQHDSLFEELAEHSKAINGHEIRIAHLEGKNKKDC